MTQNTEAVSSVLVGLSLGVALASAPGPVQAVLLGEAVRGGVVRGFRALAGASLTFGLLLACLALGLSLAPPSGLVLRILKIGGGVLLLWIAVDGLRSTPKTGDPSVGGRLSPTVRGALAVLLNPGAWLFLGAVASPLFAEATHQGGVVYSLLVALALMTGLAVGDGAVVVLGTGLRRAGKGVGLWVRRILAIVLAALGLWLLIDGVIV